MTTECRWCGETHPKGICPKVKAIKFADDGETVKRVEFMTPRDCMPANGWQMGAFSQPIPSPGRNPIQPWGPTWGPGWGSIGGNSVVPQPGELERSTIQCATERPNQ